MAAARAVVVWLGWRELLGRCVTAWEAEGVLDAEVVAVDGRDDGEPNELAVVPAVAATVPLDVHASRASTVPNSTSSNQRCAVLHPATVTRAA